MQGRNDPCDCGSGKKFKRCCEVKHRDALLPRGTFLLAAGLVVLLAGGIAATILREEKPQAQFASMPRRPAAPMPTQPTGPAPQPPGPAPAGKVWSTEHGHWHDTGNPQAIKLNTQGEGLTQTARPAAPVPQPTGPAPAGKVWSAEHGHWHDLQTGVQKASPGPVTVLPDGRAATRRPVPQPPGPAPEGKVWSAEHGHWHIAPAGKQQ